MKHTSNYPGRSRAGPCVRVKAGNRCVVTAIWRDAPPLAAPTRTSPPWRPFMPRSTTYTRNNCAHAFTSWNTGLSRRSSYRRRKQRTDAPQHRILAAQPLTALSSRRPYSTVVGLNQPRRLKTLVNNMPISLYNTRICTIYTTLIIP